MSEVETVADVPTGDAQQVTDTVKTDEARFTQADLDRIVKERLERAEKKAQDAAAKARADAEAKALAEQGKYKELHEAATARVAELEPLKERAERLESVLNKRWDAERGNVPDYLLPLLERMPVDERLDYITENREKWSKQTPPNINAGSNGGKATTRSEAEKAEFAALYGLDPRFID